jgi:hypothetical protein
MLVLLQGGAFAKISTRTTRAFSVCPSRLRQQNTALGKHRQGRHAAERAHRLDEQAPSSGCLPKLGRNPASPHMLAGTRIDPSVSSAGRSEAAYCAAALMPERRFPPPWSVVEENAACFIVKDHEDKPLAYVYCEDEPGRRSAAHLLTRDEARRRSRPLHPHAVAAPQPIKPRHPLWPPK